MLAVPPQVTPYFLENALAQTVGYCRRGDNVVLVLDADLVDSGQVTMRAFAVD